MSGKKRVVIIGGGFAGVGSLRTLAEHGEEFTVTLLEASGSLGGRTKTTVQEDGTIFELGATFLHGEEGNTLFYLAKEIAMARKRPQTLTPSPVPRVCLTSSGANVDTEQFDMYSDIVTDVLEELVHCGERDDWSFVLHPDKPDWSKGGIAQHQQAKSVTAYVKDRFLSIISHSKPAEAAVDTDLALAIADNILLREAVLNGTTYSIGVDVASYGEYILPPGDESILLTEGYGKFMEWLTNHVKHRCVFNKKVCCIDWNNAVTEAPVIVYCDDNSQYEADHVIVTVSLGILKDPTGIVFRPELPIEKSNAIESLGMGLIMKMIVTFPTALLDDSSVTKISFLWHKEDRIALANQYPWVIYMYGLRKIEGTNSWTSWFSGNEANTIEHLSDSELHAGICKAVELFINRSVDPLLVSVLRSTWGMNTLSQGSYSYNKTGSNKHDREELAKPIGSLTEPLQVLFAGEATHSTMYSTTNGAYDTGIREANRLINN